MIQQLSSRVFFEVGDTNTILTITKAKLSDAGKYEVFVENNLGTDQLFARVDIMWSKLLSRPQLTQGDCAIH